MNKIATITKENIQNKIFTIRGLQVMLDEDLAGLYQVESKRLNEQVKRNIDRFPEHFRFQLTEDEYKNLRSQIATSSLSNSLRSQIATLNLDSENNRGKHRKYLPYVFTEQGVAMLSAILKSKTAIEVSIEIIDTFVQMRKFLSNNALFSQRLEVLEQKQFKNDEKFNEIFEAIESKDIKPKQGIFYDGQVYDAYIFISDLIKSAMQSIILIDNYCDDSVLTLLSKCNSKVKTTIYTKNLSKQFQLDLEKYNQQYSKIEVKNFASSHD
ncbi:MAG: ORF6N domain-containing protein, partial [Campylobacterota bacterium]|nr:ORF6N domain-containing protein [Campylobacterota bacterium]